eukprot:1289212-Prymnesium_polylepis.1
MLRHTAAHARATASRAGRTAHLPLPGAIHISAPLRRQLPKPTLVLGHREGPKINEGTWSWWGLAGGAALRPWKQERRAGRVGSRTVPGLIPATPGVVLGGYGPGALVGERE